MDEQRKSRKHRSEINKRSGGGIRGRQEVKEKEEEERRQQRLSKRNGDLTEKWNRGVKKDGELSQEREAD